MKRIRDFLLGGASLCLAAAVAPGMFGTNAAMAADAAVAIDKDDTVWFAALKAGVVHFDPKTGNYVPSDIATETRQVFENIGSILAAAGSSFDKVVKVNVYLRDIGDFAAMNEVYARYFAAPFPARTTIQAGKLPRNFGVEIECVAAQ